MKSLKKITRLVCTLGILGSSIFINGAEVLAAETATATDPYKAAFTIKDIDNNPINGLDVSSTRYSGSYESKRVSKSDIDNSQDDTLSDFINSDTTTGTYSGPEQFTYTSSKTGTTYEDSVYTDGYAGYNNLRVEGLPGYIRSLDPTSGNFNYTRDYSIAPSKMTNYGGGGFLLQGSKVNTARSLANTVPWSFVLVDTKGNAGTRTYTATDYSPLDNPPNYQATPYQVEEIYENTSGVPITPPTGFTQNKKTYANSNTFSYTVSGLPNSYIHSGKKYNYKGWYQEYDPDTFHTDAPNISINYSIPAVTIPVTTLTATTSTGTASPTSVPSVVTKMDSLDKEGKIHVVYAEQVIVTEKYVDSNNSPISGSTEVSNELDINDPFTGSPTTTVTDSSGKVYHYRGWKTSPTGTLNTTTPSIASVSTNTDMYYVYTQEFNVTEKWVDTANTSNLLNVASLTNPTTTTKDDGSTFTSTPPTSYTDTSGVVWDYVGWEDVTNAPGTVNTGAVSVTISKNTNVNYHYKVRTTTATLDLIPTPQLVATNGDTVSWKSTLTNTGGSGLHTLKLSTTSNWTTGATKDLSIPTTVKVTPQGGTAQTFTVTAAQLATGVPLTGINIPSGQTALIEFDTVATGNPNDVLLADIKIDGNITAPITADNFVRIDDPDEPNLEPTISGNAGFINVPKYDFGTVPVELSAKTYGLDTGSYSATSQSNGLYVRYFNDTTDPNWTLTGQLAQFSNGSTQTLATATELELGAGTVNEVIDYNKPSESLTLLAAVGNQVLDSTNTPKTITAVGGKGVYQVNYPFSNVKLHVPANVGVAGVSYTADLTWTLTTSP